VLHELTLPWLAHHTATSFQPGRLVLGSWFLVFGFPARRIAARVDIPPRAPCRARDMKRRLSPAAIVHRAVTIFALAVAVVLAAPLAADATRLWAPMSAAGETVEPPYVVTNVTIYPSLGPSIDSGFLRVAADGTIAAVGEMRAYEKQGDEKVFDKPGVAIMPGMIDVHSHMGVYSWPGVDANSDGNEMTAPVTAQVRVIDAINLEDPAYFRALAGGVTTIQVLPGSGNLIGGQGLIFKLRPGKSIDDMIMKEAPRTIKMAMGENPKRVYGERGELPSTRMGNVAKLREVFQKAKEYGEKWDHYNLEYAQWQRKHERWVRTGEERTPVEDDDATSDSAEAKDEEKDPEDEPLPPEKPERDFLSEELLDVLRGKVVVNVHCYKKDDFQDYLRVADEFGFKPTSFHHSLEAYKIADELARREIAVVTWPDWWGFKMEAYDGTPWNMKICMDAGALVSIHSDSATMIQRFLHEAAKTIRYGLTPEQAMQIITINPARVLKIDRWVGSLEVGKHADFVVLDGQPFDVTTKVQQTFIEGKRVFDRKSVPADVLE